MSTMSHFYRRIWDGTYQIVGKKAKLFCKGDNCFVIDTRWPPDEVEEILVYQGDNIEEGLDFLEEFELN